MKIACVTIYDPSGYMLGLGQVELADVIYHPMA